MRQVSRLIPKKVYDILSISNYKQKEHLYFICDMIFRSKVFRPNNDNYNSFVDIPHNYFRDVIKDSSSFYSGLSYLETNKIIECDEFYSKDAGKAKGYRISNNLISKDFVKVELSKKTLINNIINNRIERNSKINSINKDFFMKNFNIDYVKAKEYIENWFQLKLNNLNNNHSYVGGNNNKTYDKEFSKLCHQNYIYMMMIEAIKDKDLRYTINNTNYRLDTNLTSLWGELKQFITIPNLYQIDISNSQPYILYLTIINYIHSYVGGNEKINQEELDLYGEWVSSGLFYENFLSHFLQHKNVNNNNNNNNLDRDGVKDIMFCIFYSKNSSFLREKDIFRSIFPSIYEWIYMMKEKDYRSLSIKMQTIESQICIQTISPLLDKENINYLTIHDAFLVDKEKVDQTKKILEDTFIKKYGKKPNVKITKITN